MVEDVASLVAVRPDRNGFDPPILGERISIDLHLFERRDGSGPLVHSVGHHVVNGRLEHHVGRPQLLRELPISSVGPHHRLGQVRRIAERRARIDPVHDGPDLFVTQRGVVLELRDPDGSVDGPGRHLPPDHAVADPRRVSPHLLVGLEHHRRHITRLMAYLTVLLDDRRHIPREREIRPRIGDERHPNRIFCLNLRACGPPRE